MMILKLMAWIIFVNYFIKNSYQKIIRKNEPIKDNLSINIFAIKIIFINIYSKIVCSLYHKYLTNNNKVNIFILLYTKIKILNSNLSKNIIII